MALTFVGMGGEVVTVPSLDQGEQHLGDGAPEGVRRDALGVGRLVTRRPGRLPCLGLLPEVGAVCRLVEYDAPRRVQAHRHEQQRARCPVPTLRDADRHGYRRDEPCHCDHQLRRQMPWWRLAAGFAESDVRDPRAKRAKEGGRERTTTPAITNGLGRRSVMRAEPAASATISVGRAQAP
jgi:hypothetical protein